MSHFKERKERNCLNCNAEVHGKYCHICGQENVEPAQTFWQLVTHFFHDLTHFDGKFFGTLKLLILKPGFLTYEYQMGRRASYLNPVKMYIFTSAVFFFIFFTIFNVDERSKAFRTKNTARNAANLMDSAQFSDLTKGLNKGVPMTREQYSKFMDSAEKKAGFNFVGRSYRDKKEYDSLLKAGVKKHNWLERKVIYKQIEINEKYKNDRDKFSQTFISILFHSFPQMLFVSLPLFALFLKWMYIRHKNLYYASHMIFTFHLYILVFIVMLFIIGINQVQDRFDAGWLNWVKGFLYVFLFFYEYKAMRNFYGQRRAKTVFKFILLNMWLLFIVMILFIIFVFFSFLKV